MYDISRIDFKRLHEDQHHGVHNAVQSIRDAVEKRLQKMIRQNPLRTDFQRHYEELVEKYNRQKDQQTIEQTFEDLLRFVTELDQESQRAVREGLDEESLAVYDLLHKPGLMPREVTRIKQIAAELLDRFKQEKLRVDRWRDKQATRDAVRMAIHDFLYDEYTGLPANQYTDDDVGALSEDVFRHVFMQYPSGADARAP